MISLVSGLLALHCYATRKGPDSSSAGVWPEISGLGSGVAVLGSALSFVLVFRLSWSFGRWWEARGLVGEAATNLRVLFVLLETTNRGEVPEYQDVVDEATITCKLYFGVLVDVLMGNPALGRYYITRCFLFNAHGRHLLPHACS